MVAVGGSGDLSTVTAVSASDPHTCALTATEHVDCWGNNVTGQLGNGTTTDSPTPVEVVGVGGTGTLSTVTAVTASDLHTCALTSAGHVYCWGDNNFGELGDGMTSTDSPTPVEVVGVGDTGTLSTVTAVTADSLHTCALTSAGHVDCWGTNSSGQLGNGTTTDSPTPVEVVGVGGTGTLSTVTAVSAGGSFNCALTSAGHVDCWGTNSSGQLGNGTTTDSPTPVEVVGVGGTGTLSTVTAVNSGGSHTCALTAATHVECWGDNNLGQLGNGTTATGSPTPVEVVGVGGTG